LSRDAIVRAAIAIADDEGLGSVSLRKVGASLDAGPMRLYSYLSTKEELLDLMVDAVYAEMVAEGPITGDWRELFRTIAHRTRRACHRHIWLIDLLGGRPHLGPSALAFLEASSAALNDEAGFEDINVVMQAMTTVNAYVIGAMRVEIGERKSPMTKGEWQASWWPYIERLIATGRFPMLAKIVQNASHPSVDVKFNWGLDCVLNGVGAKL
jgi:AcrR family transcriptional regulator